MTDFEELENLIKNSNGCSIGRDPKRIDQFLKSLGECWKTVPDWRFGQFILNTFGMLGKDPFYPEDQEMIAFFEEIFIREGR